MVVWLYWLYSLLANVWIGACAYVVCTHYFDDDHVCLSRFVSSASSRPSFVFCLPLQYYRFGDVVLGVNQTDTTTELSDLSFCLTMFTTGMGIGLFYFGASEPIYQLEASLADSYSYNAASQQAMLMTYFHFGLHTWAPFVLVGTLVALAHYRHGLPLTMRSALYPMLRERTFGWFGDLIDIISAVCGLVGVAMPLALAAMQLSAGLNWQNSAFAWTERGSPDVIEWRSPVGVLWAANFLALVSLATPAGSWKMTVFAALFVLFLTLDVFFMENSWYLLDLLQQSTAYYAQKVVQLSQHLDVFERLDEGIDAEGGQQKLSSWFVGFEGAGWVSAKASEDLGAGAEMQGGQWGWAMALTPIAGTWIARVSKGRTIKQVMHYGMLFPVVVSFVWVAIYGGSAIKMQRQAILDGCRCSCSSLGPQVQRTGDQAISSASAFSVKHGAVCEKIALNPYGDMPMKAYWEGSRFGEERDREEKTCTRQRPDGCSSIRLLSSRRPEVRMYDLLDQYEKDGDKPGTRNKGAFLNGLVLLSLLILIAACSVAGSSMITLLLSSGEDAPGNALLRFLVLGTQLSLTTALLRAGAGSPMLDPITALQSMSIVAGIVFAGILMFFPTAFRLMVQENPAFYPSLTLEPQQAAEPDNHAPQVYAADFTVSMLGGFMDIFESLFSCFLHPLPPAEEVARFVLALLFPYAILPIAYVRIHAKSAGIDPALPLLGIWMFLFWWLFICLHIVEAAPYWCGINYGNCSPPVIENESEGMWSMAWASYCLFAASVAACRNSTRHTYGIPGSVWIDVLLSLVCYPLVICQISAQEIVVTDDPQFAQAGGPPPTSPVPMEPQDLNYRHVQYSSREAKQGPSDRVLYASGPLVPDRQLYSSQNSQSGGPPSAAYGAHSTVSRIQVVIPRTSLAFA